MNSHLKTLSAPLCWWSALCGFHLRSVLFWRTYVHKEPMWPLYYNASHIFFLNSDIHIGAFSTIPEGSLNFPPGPFSVIIHQTGTCLLPLLPSRAVYLGYHLIKNVPRAQIIEITVGGQWDGRRCGIFFFGATLMPPVCGIFPWFSWPHSYLQNPAP